MKIRVAFLLTVVLLSATTIAQDLPVSSNKAAQSTVNPQEETIYDTLYFSLPFCDFCFDSIPGLGKIRLTDYGYLLCRSGTKVAVRRNISYYNEDGSNILTKSSDWLYIGNDTLFTWYHQYATTIRQERLLPFIYSFKLDSVDVYEIIHAYHSPRYHIAQYTTQGIFYNTIDHYDIQEKTGGNMRNLNYPYNVSTRLYQLFRMLEQRIQVWDKQFLFSGITAAQPAIGTEQQKSLSSWDTIQFHLPQGHMGYAYNDSIPDLGYLFQPTVTYTLTRSGSGNAIIIRKEVEHLNEEFNKTLSDTSDWLPINNDALIPWIDQYVSVIQGEDLASFIHRRESGNLVLYDHIYATHPPVYIITFDQKVRKFINLDCARDHFWDERKNINYTYNINTRLYQLYQRLDRCIRQWDKSFVFRQKETARSWDTIYFGLPFQYTYNFSMPGLGVAMLPQVAYYIATSNDNINIRKSVSYENMDFDSSFLAQSDWITIPNDTLSQWLQQYATAIKDDTLAPFIYRREEDGAVYYEELWSTHPPIWDIMIVTQKDTIRKSFNSRYLEKDTQEGRVKNINYPYNTSTKLYQLFHRLDQCMRELDTKFVLPIKRFHTWRTEK